MVSGINGASRRGCSWIARNSVNAEMILFDRLPVELRTYLNAAPVNWCVHCVGRLYRRVGTRQALASMRASEPVMLQRLNKEDGR
jgi:hypothetical protein